MAIERIAQTSGGRRPSEQLVERLSELRSQLDQVQQAAAAGQQLLDGLSPELEEFAAWLEDIETLMRRWKGRDGSEQAAA